MFMLLLNVRLPIMLPTAKKISSPKNVHTDLHTRAHGGERVDYGMQATNDPTGAEGNWTVSLGVINSPWMNSWV